MVLDGQTTYMVYFDSPCPGARQRTVNPTELYLSCLVCCPTQGATAAGGSLRAELSVGESIFRSILHGAFLRLLMPRKTFSVVIPVYNAAEFIEKTLTSVANQRYKEFEIIAVDDCSSDQSSEVISQWHARNPNVTLRLFRNEVNKMQSGSRNIGIMNAHGEWVALLDHDDIWYTNKLETILAHIAQTKYDWLCHSERVVSMSGKFVGYSKPVIPECCGTIEQRLRYLLFKGNPYSPSGTCLRTKRIQQLGPEIFSEKRERHSVEDYDLWLKLTNEGWICEAINEVLGDYLINENSMVVTHANKHYRNWRQLFGEWFGALKAKNPSDYFWFSFVLARRKMAYLKWIWWR